MKCAAIARAVGYHLGYAIGTVVSITDTLVAKVLKRVR